MAHITLIRPPTIIPYDAVTTSHAVPPLSVAYLAATLLSAGHQVDVIDAIGLGITDYSLIPKTHLLVHGLNITDTVPRISPSTDAIGVSCMFSNEWFYTKRLIQAIRRRFPDLPIIAGGEAITADPVYSLQSCPELDYCLIGEGEENLLAWVEELDGAQNLESLNGLVYRGHRGNIVRTPPRPRIREIDAIPPPAWDTVPLESYLDRGLGMGPPLGRPMPIIASRGCPYQCTFCSNARMWTTRWLVRSPERVVEEMCAYIARYQVNHFDFYDLTAIVRRDWIISFCELLIERELNTTWSLPSGTRSEAIDRETTALLFAAGCRTLTYAPESGSPTTLKRIKKRVKLPQMLESMRACVETGIVLKANLIVGFPGQTKYEAWESLVFIAKMAIIGIHDVAVFPFVAYPGSELFEDLVSAGKINKADEHYEKFLTDNIYNQMRGMTSWSEHISSRMLLFLTVGGMLWFYLLMFSLRPWRVVQTIWHLITGKHITMFERTLDGIVKNWFLKRWRARKRFEQLDDTVNLDTTM